MLVLIKGLINKMKILSIDSSANLASISIYDSDFEIVLAETSSIPRSSQLIKELQELCLLNSLIAQDFGLVLCCVGPGSFTGIRTVITIVKTIAAELDIKVFAVNSFQLLRHEKALLSSDPIAMRAGKNDYFISPGTLNEDYYSTSVPDSIPVYEFESENLSQLLLSKYLYDKSSNQTLLIGYKELEPYYLREPSIGSKKQ
jgi:tRNA A37 threonylcarbamoyladenosine modification protein TsaB